jgi:prophage regulatory protein
MNSKSVIVTSREADEIVPFSSTTRWRQEKRGRFPRRFRISARKIGYHRAEIDEWLQDPQGWVDRAAKAGA